MASPLAMIMAQIQQAGTSPNPFRATVVPTDVEKAYSDYNNAMQAAYAAKLQQQNALWGGLAGLGSAGLLAFKNPLSNMFSGLGGGGGGFDGPDVAGGP